MKSVKLIDGETGATASSVVLVVHRPHGAKAVFQATLSSTGNVVIKGRAESTMAWETLTTLTASGVYASELYNEFQVDINSNIGTINVAACY